MSDLELEKPAQQRRPKVLRRLGHLERFMEAWYFNDQYCGTSITCRYAVPSAQADPSLHKQLVAGFEHVVARTVMKHPLLQVGLVAQKGKKPFLVALDSIDLDYHVQWRVLEASEDHDAVLQDTITKQLDTKFADAETRPLWKITVLRTQGAGSLDVVFMFCHSVGDGVGGKIFQQSLLETLNTPGSDESAPGLENHILKLEDQPADYYPPPMEKMCRMVITKRFAVATAWKELRPPALVGKKHSQALWAPFRPGPATTHRRVAYVDKNRLPGIIQACRDHKTTITGLIHGLCLVSLVRQLKADQAPAFESNTAIDLRRFIPSRSPKHPEREQSPHSTFANIVTSMDHELGVALVADIRSRVLSEPENLADIEQSVWSVAAIIRDQLQKKLDKGLKNEVIGLLHLVGDWRKEMMLWAQKPRPITWHVSNLGVMEGMPTEAGPSKASGWSVAEAQFSLSAEAIGPLFAIGVMSLKGGRMCVDTSWQDGTVDDKIGEQLVSDMERWLNNFTLA